MTRSIEESLALLSHSKLAEAEYSFTRPDDTTQYASNDLVNPGTTLATVSPVEFALPEWMSGFGGILTYIYVVKSGDTTTNAGFSMTLWNMPPTAINAVDNTPISSQLLVWADRAKYIGALAFPTLAVGKIGGGAAGMPASSYNIHFESLPNNIIYGLMYATAAYVPAALEQFYFRISVVCQ